jgi:hypothetical protein
VSSTTKRLIGIVICFAPVVVALWSFCYSFAHPEIPKLRLSVIGGLAVLVVLFNLHTSFFRPSFYRWRHGSMDGFRFVSGAPLLGTIFILIESILGFGSLYTSILALLAYLLDTGGLPWFLVMTWRDEGLWEA